MIADRMARAAPWKCFGCSTRYRTELARCPRCHSTDLRTDGNIMPKITRDNDLVTMEGNPELQPHNVRTEGEGGEQSSVGTDSSTLSESQSQSDKPKSPGLQSPVPETVSPYQSDQEASDTAVTAGGMTIEEEPRPRTGRKRSGF